MDMCCDRVSFVEFPLCFQFLRRHSETENDARGDPFTLAGIQTIYPRATSRSKMKRQAKKIQMERRNTE